MPPETLSHYRILESLGAGGMGEVFKAQDTKLEREVALKLLPAEAVRDPERLQRFKKEALATSSLNHPNITTIFEIGEDGGQHFISLEYVKGKTLRALLGAEKLEMRELLAVGVQVAEGLHAAHQAGVVHRDLKPDNIMVRADGIAKILDFGLAKLSAAEAASDQEETVVQSSAGSDGLTRPGTVMGTVAYMSPEQARGQQLDHRSDVFSFGSILYEMAAGAQPFQAPSSVEVMHALIRDQPRPLHDLDPSVPAELVRIIRKAMAKSPDERYQTAKDLAIDLRALKRELESDSVTAARPAVSHSGAWSAAQGSGAAPAVQPKSGRPLLVVVGVAVVAVVVAAFFLMRGGPNTAPQQLAPLSISKLTSSGDAESPAFSPDGSFLAYETEVDGTEVIRVRQMATGSEVEVVPPRQDVLLGDLTFSPDGNWILYTTRNVNERQRTLWRVSTVGGTPREVLRDVDSAPSFSADGQRFLFARFEGRIASFLIASFTEVGEVEEVYATPEEAYVIAEPQWSSRGDITYFQMNKKDMLHPRVMIKPASGGPPQPAPGPQWMQLTGYAWSPDGSALYVCGSRSWVEPAQIWKIDPARGEARRITSDLDTYSGVVTRGDGGALAAQKTTLESHLWLVPVSGTPEENRAGTKRLTRGTDSSRAPHVHPDGTRVLFSSTADGHLNLWVMDLDGSNRKQLTFGKAQNFWSRWSPDGSSIAYASENEGDLQVWVMDADGQNAHPLTKRGTTNYGPGWSPDGKWISYVSSEGDSSFAYKIPAAGGEPRRVSERPCAFQTEWSPDGKYIASWSADRPGSPQQQIVLLPTQEGVEEQSIDVTLQSNLEAINLRWHPNGDALAIASNAGGTMNVYLLAVPEGAPRQVTDFEGDEILFTHSWSPDGTFLVAQRGLRHADIVLLENLP